MAMAAPIRMNTWPQHMTTDALTLAQLLSPSFPVGAFAYSHGLEAVIDDGTIQTADDLQGWLHCLLTSGSAHSDAVLLTLAFDADVADVDHIDALARAFAASKERLLETDLQGGAFCKTVESVWDINLGRRTYPVAVGRAAREMKLDRDLCTAMFLQAFVGNLCGAAMRLVPLGQTDGQRIQTALKPVCVAVAHTTKNATPDDLHSVTFASDIAAMRHETQHIRVFRS